MNCYRATVQQLQHHWMKRTEGPTRPLTSWLVSRDSLQRDSVLLKPHTFSVDMEQFITNVKCKPMYCVNGELRVYIHYVLSLMHLYFLTIVNYLRVEVELKVAGINPS